MQTPGNPNPAGQRRIQFELPSNLNASYANGVVISQTQSEIVMDFVQIMPNDPRARVQSRVVMTPANAKMFLQALQTNLERFEAVQGTINLPPQPASLADQLFGSVRPEDTPKPPEEEPPHE